MLEKNIFYNKCFSSSSIFITNQNAQELRFSQNRYWVEWKISTHGYSPGNRTWSTSTGDWFMSSWSTWCWEKYPIRRLRWACLIPDTGESSPRRILSKVVFPAPFSPTCTARSTVNFWWQQREEICPDNSQCKYVNPHQHKHKHFWKLVSLSHSRNRVHPVGG